MLTVFSSRAGTEAALHSQSSSAHTASLGALGQSVRQRLQAVPDALQYVPLLLVLQALTGAPPTMTWPSCQRAAALLALMACL